MKKLDREVENQGSRLCSLIEDLVVKKLDRELENQGEKDRTVESHRAFVEITVPFMVSATKFATMSAGNPAAGQKTNRLMAHSIIDHSNSKSFHNMAWISFILASIGTLVGIFLLNAEPITKGFLGMGFVFTVSSCFTLAKVIRDQHESDRLYNKVERAKTEKFLSESENPGSSF